MSEENNVPSVESVKSIEPFEPVKTVETVETVEPIERLVIVTDCGFDLDDYATIIWLLSTYDCPTLIITTFWKPEEKASILGCIVKILGRTNVEIVAGSGVYSGTERYMTETYPTWPEKFGIPTEFVDDDESTELENDVNASNFQKCYKCVYPYQTKAFKENYSDLFEDPAVNVCNFPIMIDKFMNFSKLNEVTVVGIAPFTNLAYIVQNHTPKIKNIITMSGWHGSFDDPVRPNYNVHMDMVSANIVFSQTKIPVLVFSSDFCSTFKMRQNEWDKFLTLDNKFGKTMLEVARNWEVHRARKAGKHYESESDIVLGLPITHDYITVFCALKHLNKFNTSGIHFAVHPENIFMYGNDNPIVFGDDCKSKELGAEKYLLTVKHKDESNIKLVSFKYTNDDENKSTIDEVYTSMMNELFDVISKQA